MIDDAIKESIRDATRIEDLIGSEHTLRRQGRTFVTHCPWHDDRKPSLQVNPERQSWRCWVCDVGGDAFAYVMQRDRCDFRTALEWLADRAGIDLGDKQTGPSKKRLLEVLEWAANEFANCLGKHPEAGPVRAYVKGRGISPGAAKEFRMGYSPNQWSWLRDRATSHGFQREELTAAGLTIDGERGSFDRFRGRLLFPIADANSAVVGFGGRVLPGSEEKAKYVNSPETALFSKQRLLYGLHLAEGSIREAKVAAIMEGYTDVIACHQAAVNNVTAVMGTALTEHHCRLITRYAQRAALVFDGDEAGTKRTAQCLPALLATGLDVCVVEIPNEQDPAEFIAAKGGQAFHELVESAPIAVDYLAQKCRDEGTAGDGTVLQHVLSVLSGCRGDEMRLKVEQAIARISRVTGVSTDAMRRVLAKPQPNKKAAKREEPVKREPIPRADLELWWAAFRSESVAGMVVESVADEQLGCSQSRALLGLLRDMDLAGKPLTHDAAMQAADDLTLKSLIESVRVMEVDAAPSECFESIQQRWRLTGNAKTRHDLLTAMASLESETEQLAALDRLLDLKDAY